MPQVSLSRDEIAKETLPSVCLVCGKDAEHYLFPNVAPPSLAWILFSPLFGILAFWGSILFADRSTSGGLPFCDRHQNYWPRRAWFILGGFLALIGLCAIGVALTPSQAPGQKSEVHWMFGVFGCWMLIYLPAFLLVHLSSMRPIGSTRRELVLAGVNRKFIDALHEDEDESDDDSTVS